jgi:DNA-binding response OmpR family regulator
MSPPSEEGGMGKRHRILIIDDNKEIVSALKAYLERSYEILTTHDGFEGLHAFEEHENGIDLVITDLLMPDLSGVGVISIVRKKYPGIPIVAITAWRGDVEASGKKIDADLILEKPFQIPELEKSVSKLLANRGPSSFFG